jgi:hypothetical protein
MTWLLRRQTLLSCTPKLVKNAYLVYQKTNILKKRRKGDPPKAKGEFLLVIIWLILRLEGHGEESFQQRTVGVNFEIL